MNSTINHTQIKILQIEFPSIFKMSICIAKTNETEKAIYTAALNFLTAFEQILRHLLNQLVHLLVYPIRAPITVQREMRKKSKYKYHRKCGPRLHQKKFYI